MKKQKTECWEADDHRLVSALMEDDEGAWNYVVTELVTPLVRANIKGIAEMLNRFSIPLDALAGKLFLDLKKNDFIALRNFRYECKFSSFLYWRVYHAAQGLIRETSKEFDFLLSDEVLDDAPTEQKDSSQLTQLKDEIKSANRMLAVCGNRIRPMHSYCCFGTTSGCQAKLSVHFSERR